MKNLSALLMLMIALSFGGVVQAQTASALPTPPDMQALLKLPDEEIVATMEKFRASLKDLTPEQREQMRAARKAKMESLTPEQRKQVHEQVKQRVGQMTPEQRDRFRAAMGHDPRDGGPLRSDKLKRFKAGEKPPRALPPPPIDGATPPPAAPVPPPSLPE